MPHLVSAPEISILMFWQLGFAQPDPLTSKRWNELEGHLLLT